MAPASRIRVLIVDDSAMMRRLLTMSLSADPRFDVVGSVSNADAAVEAMDRLSPDVMTIDIEMPGCDGLTLLRTQVMPRAIPAVVISVHTAEGEVETLQAMTAGAVDVIAKPRGGIGHIRTQMMDEVCDRIAAAASIGSRGARFAPQPSPMVSRAPLFPRAPAPAVVAANAPALLPSPVPSLAASAAVARPLARRPASDAWVIGIGASTGGVQALSDILPLFPEDCPPIVIVQHMPAGFTRAFATRLDASSAIEVREACDGDVLRPGLALLAPGGTRHMRVMGSGGPRRIALDAGPPVNYSRPSVDVLFQSLAATARQMCAAALLTGMGRDGAEGLRLIREAGGMTLAQDRATAVVNGMPQAAEDMGACERRLPLLRIPAALIAGTGAGARKADET